MMPTSNGVVWMPSEHEAVSSWDNNEEGNTCKSLGININPHPSYPLTTSLKSMLENEWLVTNSINNSHGFLGSNHPEFTSHNNLLLPSMDSSSCYPSQSHSQFFAPKSSFSSLLNLPYDSGFDLGCDSVFMTNCESPVLMSYNGLNSVPNGELGSTSEFASTHLVQISDDIDNSSAGIGFNGVEFDRFEGPSLGNDDMSKMLRPLEVLPTEGEHQQQQQTLFEKRADFREGSDMGNLGKFEDLVKKRKRNVNEDGDEFDEGSIDISGSFNYDSDEFETKNVNNNYGGGSEIWDNSNANDSVTVGEKGKKKGLPAKNLMAERRRRKKLNDRLYMLRSIVPKISKMDRASILGDAVDYLKELLQRINDLNNELEATPPGSSTTTPTSSFQPLTPTPVTFPYHVKEEMHSGSLPSPKNTSARVEVRAREGRAVNIHMFCARRPGLLLSTMRALDSLELDIQQAVISCFNGFALDIFRAEQCSENKDVLPEQIKAVLLDSVGFHGAM